MFRKTAIILSLLLPLLSFGQSDTVRVLFLGNSYTQVNNLPDLVEQLAQSANIPFVVDGNTLGGYTLEQHATNASTLEKIRRGNWDFVILQEQSQFPTIDHYRYNSMYPSGENLRDSIKLYNPCANVMLFMTWGRRFGGQQCDDTGVYCSPDFVDFSHMQDSLESAYVELGMLIDAYISPVGIAWKTVIESDGPVLHSGDNSHPNFSGSYLAAAVFYGMILDQSPIGNSFTGTLSETEAAYLQTVADSTVFHSYSNWNRDVDQVVADFSTEVLDATVLCTNLSTSLETASYLWDFGDGSTSTEEHPTHTYEANQTYSVSLKAERCSKQDSITKLVQITTVQVEGNPMKPLIQLYPNPATTYFELSIDQIQDDMYGELFNQMGRKCLTLNLSNVSHFKQDISTLQSGIYLLKIGSISGDFQKVYKVCKQ